MIDAPSGPQLSTAAEIEENYNHALQIFADHCNINADSAIHARALLDGEKLQFITGEFKGNTVNFLPPNRALRPDRPKLFFEMHNPKTSQELVQRFEEAGLQIAVEYERA